MNFEKFALLTAIALAILVLCSASFFRGKVCREEGMHISWALIGVIVTNLIASFLIIYGAWRFILHLSQC